MKKIIFVTPMKEIDEKLGVSTHTIIYYDEENDATRIALCDYYNQFVDVNNLDRALNSKYVAVYQNVQRKKIRTIKSPVIMLTLDDDIVTRIDYNGHAINLFANRVDGKTLVKRLK